MSVYRLGVPKVQDVTIWDNIGLKTLESVGLKSAELECFVCYF